MKPSAPEARFRGLLAFILLQAAALRFHGLSEISPLIDEYQQIFLGLQPQSLAGFLSILREIPHHMLLDPLLSFLPGRFGDSLWLFRLPRLLLGVLAVLGLWRLAGLADARRGALAAFLLSISLLHIDWSRRVDFYALMTALSVWQAWALFRSAWKSYFALSLLFLYSHPYGVLTLPLHLLWTITRRPAQIGPFAQAWAASLLLFAPWFFFSAAGMLDNRFLSFEMFPGRYTLGEFLRLIPLYLGQAPEAGPLRSWELSSSSLLSIAYALFYLISLVKTLRGKADELTRFSHSMLLLGILMVIGLDLWYGYFFAHRQLLWLLPFYLLAVSEAAVARGKHIILGLTAAVLFFPAYLQTTQVQRRVGSGLEALAADVRRFARPQDVLGFQDEELLMGFLYHYDRKAFPQAAELRLSRGVVKFHLTPKTLQEGKLVLLPSTAKNLWSFQGKPDDLSVSPPLRQR